MDYGKSSMDYRWIAHGQSYEIACTRKPHAINPRCKQLKNKEVGVLHHDDYL
jgi:hypothetical protein